MASLNQAVGQDVPTFDEVRSKIEAQYARALGTAEVAGQGVEARMLEIEQASVSSEAKLRLETMRSQMGLPLGQAPQAAISAPGPAAALGTGAPADQPRAQDVGAPGAVPSQPASPSEA